MPLEMKPFVLDDFSGGLTDNYLTGGPAHYVTGDNFWINVQHKLGERYGTQVIDPTAYNLGGLPQRISGLFTYINETILLGQSARNFYWYNPNNAWNVIQGPSGGEALMAGDTYSSVVACEWQRHFLFASDAQGNPGKIYRDSTNTYQVRTLGMPRTFGAPNLTNDQILQACISNANNLANAMIAHIQDTNLHGQIDYVALNYFIAQQFVAGQEQPPAGVTPISSCNNFTTLIQLISALQSSYEHQRKDASLNGARIYHNNIYSYASGFITPYSPTGMHIKLSNTIPATTQITSQGAYNSIYTNQLVTCAAQVDDIQQKWYWHRLACWTHDQNNIYSTMNQYGVSQSKIGTITTGQPIITANLTDPYNFVANCAYFYNTHLSNGGATQSAHKTPDSGAIAQGGLGTQTWSISLPAPFDYDSYANMIFHLRCLYYQHYTDAAGGAAGFGSRLVTYTSTGGSNQIAGLSYTVPFAANIILTNAWLFTPSVAATGILPWSGGVPAGFAIYANTIAGTYNIQVSDANATALNALSNVNSQSAQLSFNRYHVALDQNGNIIDTVQTSFAPTAQSKFATQVDSVGTDAKSWMSLASELFFILAAHMSDTTVHATAAPIYSASTNMTLGAPNQPFFIPTVASYSWAFIFQDQYTVEPNGLIYLAQSNPVFVGPVETSTIIPPSATILSQSVATYPNVTNVVTQSVQVTSIPSVTNALGTNYNTSNIQVGIYRSTDGGVTYYNVANIANGTTTYTDATADSASYSGFPQLTTLTPIYTTGGVVGNDQPPPASIVATLANYFYFAGIVDTNQAFPNRIRQSNINAPDSAPATFTDDLEDRIVMLSSTRSVLIALCVSSIYRVTGNYNTLGQGSMVHEKISDTMGCISAKSVIKTEIGVFFAGIDGFYYTDGYQLIKISIEINARYQAFTQSAAQQKRIVGAYDKFNRRIYWTMQTNPTDSNPDTLWCYYLDYGVKPEGVFTTMSNFTYFRPASVIVFNGYLTYGHEMGYVLAFVPWVTTDPIINTSANPSTWNTTYIPYTYASCAVDFGTQFKRKYTTKVHYLGNNIGNAQIQVTSIRDNNASIPGLLKPIEYNFNPIWGMPNIVWGQPTATAPYPWETDQKADFWRRFPAGNLRCNTKQIILTPSFNGVYRSNDWPFGCYANVNGSTKTISIITPTGYSAITWPLDIVGMVFSFQTDGYVQQWTISSVSGASAVVADPNSTLTTMNSVEWVIRGYRKQQRVSINSLIMYYDYLGDKNTQYPGPAGSGENTT